MAADADQLEDAWTAVLEQIDEVDYSEACDIIEVYIEGGS